MTLHAASVVEQREIYDAVRTELVDHLQNVGTVSLSADLRSPLMNVTLFGLASVLSESDHIDSYEVTLKNTRDETGGDIANLRIESVDTEKPTLMEAVAHRGGSRIFKDEDSLVPTKQQVAFLRLLLANTIWDEQIALPNEPGAVPQKVQA